MKLIYKDNSLLSIGKKGKEIPVQAQRVIKSFRLPAFMTLDKWRW
jgi:hypothetical protein